MASNVTSAVAKAGEYNLVGSQEQSEKSCCQKVKEAVCGFFKAIGDFFEKVISFLKEYCCCKKSKEKTEQAIAKQKRKEEIKAEFSVKHEILDKCHEWFDQHIEEEESLLVKNFIEFLNIEIAKKGGKELSKDAEELAKQCAILTVQKEPGDADKDVWDKLLFYLV